MPVFVRSPRTTWEAYEFGSGRCRMTRGDVLIRARVEAIPNALT